MYNKTFNIFLPFNQYRNKHLTQHRSHMSFNIDTQFFQIKTVLLSKCLGFKNKLLTTYMENINRYFVLCFYPAVRHLPGTQTFQIFMGSMKSTSLPMRGACARQHTHVCFKGDFRVDRLSK